jgi:class 3 adenylate cyclase/CheY-like chemotaxis protein
VVDVITKGQKKEFLSEAGGVGSNILMMGDDPLLKENIKSILSPYSFSEASGEDVLEKVRECLPDIIICEQPNPEKNGFKWLRTVRANKELNHVPVILISDDNSEDMRVEGLETGANDYIARPFNEKELLLRVTNLLKLRVGEKMMKRSYERLIKFFPGKLVNWIHSPHFDTELNSEKKILTIFFSDLSGFTEFAETTPPEKVMDLLNDYFTEMVKIVDQCDGTLDKFIGDGLMVFFGAPEFMDERVQAVRAVSMALAMQMKMKELTQKWQQQGIRKPIHIRMGIHQDLVMVGNFGARHVMEYTVFGSGVNLANRLESYCEPQKILVSYPVYVHTKGLFPYSKIVNQQFRGFERLVPVSVLDPEKIETHPK